MNSATQPKSLINIQYLRAIAALMVVWMHARDHFVAVKTQFPSEAGASGVDLFFVISGFIMVFTTYGKHVTPGQFMRRRLERIAPLYWLATLAVVVVASLAPALLKSTLLSGPHIGASFAFVPMLSPAFPDNYWPLVIPGWTLNYEIAFYAVFAATLWLQGVWRLIALGTVLTSVVLCGAAFGWTGVAGFYSKPIILIFLSGSFIGYLLATERLKSSRLGGALMVIFGFSLWLGIQHAQLDYPFIRGGLPATLIVIGFCMMPALHPTWLKWLAQLGDSSYSIYLSHVFVLALLRNLLQRSGISIDSVTSGWLYMLLSVALSAACGLFIFKFVEQFLAQKIAKRHARMPSFVAPLIAK
jgi:exopolysaccharide production protein ExoZ